MRLFSTFTRLFMLVSVGGCDIRKDLAPENADTHKRSGTGEVLTPERLWHQKMADTGNALAPEKCCIRKALGTRKMLTPDS